MYLGKCLIIPDGIIKQVDERISRFLWGKGDHIKRKSVIINKRKQVLSMLDLHTSLYAIKPVWTSCVITCMAPSDYL